MHDSTKNHSNKRNAFECVKYIVLAAFFFCVHTTGFSQVDSIPLAPVVFDSSEIKYDSAKNELFNLIKESGASEHKKNRLEYVEDSISTRQDEMIELIKKLTLEAQTYLDNGIDTTGLSEELEKIENWYDVTCDGVFVNLGSMQTHRNLETSFKIMRELLIRITARKSSLDEYYKKLVGFRNTIDSLYKEDVLYSFSSDTAVLMRYVAKLTVVSQEIKPIDSALKKTLLSISELQPPINMLANKLNASIEQIQLFQKDLSTKIFRHEVNTLWQPVKFTRPFDDIIRFSLLKATLSFVFYVQNEVEKFIFLLLLVGVCTNFLTRLKRNIQRQNKLDVNSRDQSILKYPLLSSLFIVLNIFQFVFIDPPFLFSALIWILSGLSLTFILANVVARYWMFSWLIMFVLFLFACFDNLILQASRPERWMMLALSGVSILACLTILLRGLTTELKEKLLFYFIGFLVILEAASILTNVYGRYNLAKTCLTAGFFNVVLAILFFWTLYFINQVLALSARVYDRSNRKLFNINFEHAGGKPPSVFYVLLFVGWFLLFGRNFYVFQYIAAPVKDFIIEKRNIGEVSFTIGKLLEFFMILYISGIISRMVSFFASVKHSQPVNSLRKGGIGSWLLIIRIAIFTVGILVAFAAVGIPMDRLTIILSALSVGVGFGLQSLVNNLVSGLIISFERPLSVGDIIEIGDQSGIVKSIGFRSSIITTNDGANVVIPNGDLLDQHLVNWTHENPSRSLDIIFSVPYRTDLQKVIKILTELPGRDKRVLAKPEPNVVVRQFNQNAIEMQLSFWIENLTNLPEIKSDIMLAIDQAFEENSIEMALPPQLPPPVNSL